MMSDASAIVTAVNARLAALEGVAILEYEPTAPAPPMLYTLVTGAAYESGGGAVAVRYHLRTRLCLLWQHSATAESQTLAWLEQIAVALGVGTLAGTGGARLLPTRAEIGFATIGGVKLRALDFYCTVDAGVVRAPHP